MPLESGKWYYPVVVKALSDAAWLALASPRPRLQSAVVDALVAGAGLLLRCVSVDGDVAECVLASGPTDQRQQYLPQSVVTSAPEVTPTVVVAADGTQVEVWRLPDGSSARFASYAFTRLDAAATSTVATEMAGP
jgi:hypothetical protein